MASTMTSKGQVTIPKNIRDALGLGPGSAVEFAVGKDGEVVLQKAGAPRRRAPDRYDRARGMATVPWRTRDLMALLRSDEPE